jgi:hypothetical protein
MYTGDLQESIFIQNFIAGMYLTHDRNRNTRYFLQNDSSEYNRKIQHKCLWTGALCSVYAQITLQKTLWLLNDLLYTSQEDGQAPLHTCWCIFRQPYIQNDLLHTSSHHVHADVFLDYSYQWMTYYTHYMKMAARHYVCVDVSSDDSAD